MRRAVVPLSPLRSFDHPTGLSLVRLGRALLYLSLCISGGICGALDGNAGLRQRAGPPNLQHVYVVFTSEKREDIRWEDEKPPRCMSGCGFVPLTSVT